jgi:DNA-binding HxlR family transcriptional regulator
MVATAPKPAPSVLVATCTSRQVLDLIADKWTALIFYALEGGTKRFSELRRTIDGVSQKMLTQTLRAMERDGLVRREVYPVVPPIAEYSLTALGRTLIEPMQVLRRWAEVHTPEVERARAAFDRFAGERYQPRIQNGR